MKRCIITLLVLAKLVCDKTVGVHMPDKSANPPNGKQDVHVTSSPPGGNIDVNMKSNSPPGGKKHDMSPMPMSGADNVNVMSDKSPTPPEGDENLYAIPVEDKTHRVPDEETEIIGNEIYGTQ